MVQPAHQAALTLLLSRLNHCIARVVASIPHVKPPMAATQGLKTMPANSQQQHKN
jgi:hypothetical protein